MSIEFNANLTQALSKHAGQLSETLAQKPQKSGLADNLTKGLGKVNELQDQANHSITDLLTGKQQDINSTVATVAKADMSFKLLVGVRNKLVQAYKETMTMNA